MMKTEEPEHEKLIFVCTGTACSKRGGEALRQALKQAVKDGDVKGKVRATGCGCIDQCDSGPNVYLAPEHTILTGVSLKDVKKILKRAQKGK